MKVKVEVSEPALILGRKWRGCSLYSLGVYQDRAAPLESGGALGSHRHSPYTYTSSGLLHRKPEMDECQGAVLETSLKGGGGLGLEPWGWLSLLMVNSLQACCPALWLAAGSRKRKSAGVRPPGGSEPGENLNR